MTVERMSVEQLEKWRADPGWTAITLEVMPHTAVTESFPDRDLDEALREFETQMKITEELRKDLAFYAGMRRQTVRQLAPAVARFDKSAISNCGVAALWCVLNHPNDQGAMRLKMDALRAEGLAPHFTLCRGPGQTATFGTALGDRYVDIRRDVQHRIGANRTIFATRPYPKAPSYI